MMKDKKKAIFLDMDGTTLDDNRHIPMDNLNALEKVTKAGHEVVITTGRATPSAKLLLETHGLDKIGCRYIISYNGGEIYDYEKDEILYSKILPQEVIFALVQKAKEFGIYIQAYDKHKVLSEQEDENLIQYIGKTNMEYEIVADLAQATEGKSCKMLAIDLESQEKLEQFAKEIEASFSDKIDVYFSSREYLEIMPKGVSKGNALLSFCEKLGIFAENSIAVGDESNDVSMICKAGIGCAVANAIEEVKLAADYISEKDNNHCAVCEIIDKFMF